MSITNTKDGSNSNASKSKESGTDIATSQRCKFLISFIMFINNVILMIILINIFYNPQ